MLDGVQGEEYSMVLVLPNKVDGLKQLEAKLANKDIESLVEDLTYTEVEVTIPKFKVEYGIELANSLKNVSPK